MRSLLSATLMWLLALPAFADARHTVLMDVLQVAELSLILAGEGQEYAQALNDDMLNGEGGAGWQVQVDAIYDPGRIAESLRVGLEGELSGDLLEETIAFFASGLGQKIVTLENSARVTMAQADVEEAARALYTELEGSDDARLALVVRMIEAGDLVPRNVSSAMNSNVQFLRGLVDGKAHKMSEAEILDDVMSGRDEMTGDTTSWLHGFMLLAYSPLSEEELLIYAKFSESPAGLALNRGFFDGFDPLYEDISYALGRAVALNMLSEEL